MRIFKLTVIACLLLLPVIQSPTGAEQETTSEVQSQTEQTVTEEPTDTQSQPSPKELLRAMDEAWASVDDLTYTLHKKERMMDGELVEEKIAFKMKKNPYQVYSRLVEPARRQEALFREGWNDGELMAHPGRFPDITVSLNPRGSLAMKNQHHSIYNGGFSTFINLTLHSLDVGEEMEDEGAAVRYMGEGTWDGRPTHKIELESPHVPPIKYRAKDDESLWDIAEKHNSAMYLLLYENEEYDDPWDVDEGDIVEIPRFYASRVVVQIDQETGLPVEQSIYGHDGKLYEYYAFEDLELNVGLTEKDFDPDNESYDF